MTVVWPSNNDILPSLANLTVGDVAIATNNSKSDQAITAMIDVTLDADELDVSVFDKSQVIPNFHDILRRHLVQQSFGLNSTVAFIQLFRIAFAG